MNTIDPRGSAVHSSASKFLIFIIIVVLFSAFYIVGSDYKNPYSTRFIDPSQRDLSITAITSGSIQRRIGLISLGLFWGLFLFRKKRYSFATFGNLYWLIITYIAWAAISVFWADDYQLVSRRIIVLIILAFSAYSTSVNVSLRQTITIVFWTCSLVLAIGILSELFAGVFLPFSEGYRFAGTIHPNNQGRNCAMLFLAAIAMTKSDNRMARLFYRMAMILAFIFVLLTRSRSTFVATIIALVVFKWLSEKRSKNFRQLYVLVLIFCIAFLIFSDALFPILGAGVLLGREEEEISQLNGRLELWAECIDYAQDRPILGYGFHGFWTEERVRAIANSQGWSPHASHSTYIENFLNLGLVGLSMFLMMVIVGWWTARGAYLNQNDLGMGFALSLLTLWLAGGLLDRPVGGLDYLTYLFFVVLFGIAREHAPRKEVGGI